MYDDGVRHEARGFLVLALVALLLAGSVAGAWLSGRGPFTGRGAAAGGTPPAGARGARTAAAAGHTNAACSIGIGTTADPAAAGAQATVSPGQPVSVLLRCAATVSVVDLVVSAPAPAGVLTALVAERTGQEGDVVRWVWQGIVPQLPGATLTFYAFADGEPTAAPVVLVVSP